MTHRSTTVLIRAAALAAGVTIGCGPITTPIPDPGSDAAVDAALGTCGTSRDCAPGQECCALSGRCQPAGCLACCMASAPCDSNGDCAPSHYCQALGCSGRGVCSQRPLSCAQQYDPVCGCDRQSYPSICHANAAGVRVSSLGTCLKDFNP